MAGCTGRLPASLLPTTRSGASSQSLEGELDHTTIRDHGAGDWKSLGRLPDHSHHGQKLLAPDFPDLLRHDSQLCLLFRGYHPHILAMPARERALGSEPCRERSGDLLAAQSTSGLFSVHRL